MNADDEEVLAALRAYPFYEFDTGRVAVRAFFLGERSSDSFTNWLEAERLETIEQAQAALGFSSTARSFLLEYELIDRVRFLTNEPRRKEYRGDRRGKRRCTVCGHEAPAVCFSTEPHLLPACTGNRFLYTAEECDTCNLGSGKDTEDDLGKMLAPHRAIGRIQTRTKPSTTLQVVQAGSSIGGQGRDEPLRLSLVEGSATVDVIEHGENHFEIRARTASYRPVSALRSLARAAWHLLPSDVKAANAPFLQWATVTPSLCPARYIEAFIPGPGLRHTTFAVWRRRRGTGPALMFMLALGNLILLVPSQDDQTTALLVPPLPFSPYGQPKLRSVQLRRDDPISPTLSHEVRFLSRSLIGIAKPEAVVVTARTPTGNVVQLECEIDVLPIAQPDIVGYLLRGGALRGEVTITGQPMRLLDNSAISGGRFSVQYGVAEDASDGDVESTFRFVEAIASGAELTMKLKKDGRSVVSEITLLPLPNFDRDSLLAALNSGVA